MAFDQNSIPINLPPLNIARTVIEEPRIAPVATSGRNIEGFYANPSRDFGGSVRVPVCYPATVSDAGFVGLGCGNASVPGAAGWVQRIPATGVGTRCVGSPAGYGSSPKIASRVVSSCSDRASDEGGDDSASGKKVKLLCSYGGKILPRPSDGALRYVGGQTRIISVKRDVSFNELVKKMADSYERNVVIKYQLPDEDLDALVLVSGPEDLENMMEEYDKLLVRSLEGSAKLRVFLFPASELDSSSVVHMGDFQDSGQRYVEALNGIVDGSGGGIIRRESTGSATSMHDSDMSETEVIDSSSHGLVDVSGPPSTGGLSPKNNSTTSQETSPRLVCVDPNPAIYVESSGAPLGIQMVKPHPLPTLSVRPVTLVQPQQMGGFLPPAPYLPAPQQEALNQADYVQYHSQMGFPAQLAGTVGPMYTQPQCHGNAVSVSPHLIPPVNMTMTLSSHASIKRNTVQPFVQPQQVRLERFPEENTYNQRVVQLPVDQSYNAYHTQVSPAVLGGYDWHRAPQAEQFAFSEGLVPRFEDCHMCRKALPHTHSDTIAESRKDSSTISTPDLNSVYCSHLVEDHIRGQPINRAVVTGPMGDDNAENEVFGARPKFFDHMGKEAVKHQGVVVSQNAGGQYVNGGTFLQREDNHNHPQALVSQGVVGLAGGLRPPYSVFVGNVPQLSQEIVGLKPVGPPQFLMQDNAFSKPKMVLDANHDKQNEMLPYSSKEVPYSHNFQPEDLYDVALQPLLVNPGYPHPRLAINHLGQDARSYGNPAAFSGVDLAQETGRIPPVGDWKDNPSRHQPNLACRDVEARHIDGNIPSSVFPANRVGDMQDNSNSLFSQDPWNLQFETHIPPPKPNKILTRKDAYATRDPSDGNSEESPMGAIGGLSTELRPDDGVYQPSGNLDTDYTVRSCKGSAEEHIKQELQAVAEGVAASVLQPSIPSNPDSSIQESEVKNSNVEEQHTDKSEDIKPKLPERANVGFPVSDGIGRLQIIKNSDLEELRELGSGTFGTVYHGKWRGCDVAIKRINERCFVGKPSEQERMRNDFWNEAINLADLHHPNVVAFYGVVLDGPGGSVATVTEYMVNGSLRTALQKNEKNLDKRKRLLIAMDVAFGMEYLHGKNIVHFDLKSDNLLVNLRDPHRPVCKVGDLGLSKVKCQTLISGGVRGTLPWMAPELLNGSSSLVSEKVDVFSFGIVLWELLTGDEPYADLHYGAIIGGIVSNTLRPFVPDYCDPEWKSLMERCWTAEPPERPTFTEIANQLRNMAARVPPKVQVQQQPPSTQAQVKN